MSSGAWGRKPSDAIRAPPSQTAQRQSSFGRQNSGGGGGRRPTRQRSGGRGGNYNNNKNSRNNGRRNSTGNNSNSNNNKTQHYPDVKLLGPGEGSTPNEKAVKRVTVDVFFATRLASLDTPEGWEVPDAVLWNSPTRVDEITASTKAPRKTGDVSRSRRASVKETAPPLEDCKPLEVNEETRWKSRAFEAGGEQHPSEGSDEEVLRKALLILNKLSLTKFEKLSTEFVDTGIGRNAECLNGAVGLIVDKAQSEPHFANMYARLCHKLSKIPMDGAGGKKAFKKMLLSRCQQEFEEEIATKVERAVEGVDAPDERSYHANIIKKKYLGHMRFIGELYKVDIIKNDIMLRCLKTLLEDFEEEKVECFAKLMTTIGYSLEQHSIALMKAGKPGAAEDLRELWKSANSLCDGSSGQAVSNRIKFMLLDLKEMKDNGWVKRREEESAKTIEQIHKDVAREEARMARRSSSKGLGRRGSTSDLREKPVVDEDGFVKVVRSASTTALSRSVSETVPPPVPGKKATLRRATSYSVPDRSEKPPKPSSTRPKKKVLSLEDCEKKSKNTFKEYFVGGDTNDAVLSIDEMVDVASPGSIDRGAKVVEAAVLLVLEMKEENVKKVLNVLARVAAENKIDKASFVQGLNDPLEFLRDIEIDAPIAGSLLCGFIAELLRLDLLEFDFLLAAPEEFRNNGQAAKFAGTVAKRLDLLESEQHLAVIERLMTDDDKALYASSQELVKSL